MLAALLTNLETRPSRPGQASLGSGTRPWLSIGQDRHEFGGEPDDEQDILDIVQVFSLTPKGPKR